MNAIRRLDTRRRTRRRVVAAATAAAALALGLANCSIPADDQVTPIGADELGPELANTTTTTTTIPATAPISSPATGDSTTTSTTTTIAIPTRVVNTYFTIGNSGALQFVPQRLIEPVSIQSVIEVLVDPSEDLRNYAPALSTSVRRGLIAGVPQFDRAMLTVSLDGEILDRMPEPQRRYAIAQIVLTLTSFTTDRGNIGSIRFQVDGETISVTLPDGVATDEPVIFDDFASSIATTPSATPTTTVAPATTRPPVITPPPTETTTPPASSLPPPTSAP